MAKNKINEYSTSAASNTDIGGIGTQGTNLVSNFDNAFREIMKQLADMNIGTSPIFDTMRWCDPDDNTKLFRFDGVGVATGQIRVLSIPDVSSTLAVLGLAQTWTAAQTFAQPVTISATNPTLTLTDTDTGADSTVTANNSSGSLVISADINNEVANSVIQFQIDGSLKGSLDANGKYTITSLLLGSGATVNNIFTGSKAHDFGTVSAHTETSTTVTVTGATTGANRFVTVAFTGTRAAQLVFTGQVTAADTVTIYCTNGSTSNIASGNRTYSVLVTETS